MAILHKILVAAVVALYLQFSPGAISAQQPANGEAVHWTGYMQTRYTSNFHNRAAFSLRRAKMWVWGRLPVSEKWHFKVQGIFRVSNAGAFTLQDVVAEYRWKRASVFWGQMVPEFSLQRSQPDFLIPLSERGSVVDALIPSAETGARDIGIQVKFTRAWKRVHGSFGVFNGSGANQKSYDNRQFLVTHRFLVGIVNKRVNWKAGYSLAYRETDGLVLKKITGNSHLFKGRDFRWGVESQLTASGWEIQAEYLEARLESDRAWGYYVLAAYGIGAKNQVVISMDKYTDCDPRTDDNAWYITAFNHYFTDYRVKLSFDNRVHFAEKENRYQTMVQFQLFLNKP